jgi:hypothetical protein
MSQHIVIAHPFGVRANRVSSPAVIRRDPWILRRMRKMAICPLVVLLASFWTTGCIQVINPKQARVGQVIGIVVEPRSTALRIKVATDETRDILTDDMTHYTKWLTHQPWAVDQLVGATSASLGRCVKVTVQEAHPRLARRIEISLDRAGTSDDPCLRIR